jgi:hypothetical protein
MRQGEWMKKKKVSPNRALRFIKYGEKYAPPKQSHPRLRKALSMISKDCLIRDFPDCMRLVVWELMKTQTRLAKLEQRK